MLKLLSVPSSDTWHTYEFKELFDIRIGGTPSRSKLEYWEGETEHPWVSIADMKQGHIFRTKETITDSGVANSNVKLIPADTVLLSFKLTLGRIAVAGVPLYTNEAIAALVPRIEGVNQRYVMYALKYVDLSAELDIAVKGQTLNKDKLGRLKMTLPPHDVQTKIAEILDAFEESIEATREKLAHLENIRDLLGLQIINRIIHLQD